MSNSMKESDIFRPILSWCSLDHLFLAPKTARKSTAINADPTIATDLTTTSVRALSAGEVIRLLDGLQTITSQRLVYDEQASRSKELSKLLFVFGFRG